MVSRNELHYPWPNKKDFFYLAISHLFFFYSLSILSSVILPPRTLFGFHLSGPYLFEKYIPLFLHVQKMLIQSVRIFTQRSDPIFVNQDPRVKAFEADWFTGREKKDFKCPVPSVWWHPSLSGWRARHPGSPMSHSQTCCLCHPVCKPASTSVVTFFLELKALAL